MQTLTPQTNKQTTKQNIRTRFRHACVESHDAQASKQTNKHQTNINEHYTTLYTMKTWIAKTNGFYAPFLIAAEFTIRNNIRQIKMINIELKPMEMWKAEQRGNYIEYFCAVMCHWYWLQSKKKQSFVFRITLQRAGDDIQCSEIVIYIPFFSFQRVNAYIAFRFCQLEVLIKTLPFSYIWHELPFIYLTNASVLLDSKRKTSNTDIRMMHREKILLKFYYILFCGRFSCPFFCCHS